MPQDRPDASARVLVVDDDRAVRESLRRSLEFNGYDVALANDGAEALASIAGRAPDALVIDVMMPGMDGLEGPAPPVRRLRDPADGTKWAPSSVRLRDVEG